MLSPAGAHPANRSFRLTMMLTEVADLTMDEHTAQRQRAANYAPILRILFTLPPSECHGLKRGKEGWSVAGDPNETVARPPGA